MLSLRQQGKSQRRIARELGVRRGRVVAYLREGVPDGARVRRGSITCRTSIAGGSRAVKEPCRSFVSSRREATRAVAAWLSATAETCVSAWLP